MHAKHVYTPVARFPAAHVATCLHEETETRTGEVDKRKCNHLHISGMGKRTSSWVVAGPADALILIRHAIIFRHRRQEANNFLFIVKMDYFCSPFIRTVQKWERGFFLLQKKHSFLLALKV